MDSFTSVLFRLANMQKHSIICIELAVVENNKITDEKYWLLNPECEFDIENTAQREYLTEQDIKGKATLPQVWDEIRPYFQDKIVVTQNTAHVINMLKHALNRYNIEAPNFIFYDSKDLAKKTFGNFISYDPMYFASEMGLTYEYGFGNFSRFVAELTIKILNTNKVSSFSELENKYKVSAGTFSQNKYEAYHSAPLAPKDKKAFLEQIEVNANADPSHPFYGKYIVFTGKLEIERKHAAALAAEKGGVPQAVINKDTNFLVVGDFNPNQLTTPDKSKKIITAEKKLATGQDIEIIAEYEFLEMVN